MEVGGNASHGKLSKGREGSPLLMLGGAGKHKKVKEAWPSITTGSAEVANKGVGRTVFTKVSPVHTSHSSEDANGCPRGWHSLVLAVRKKSFWLAERSSFPARNEQLRKILQLWANLNCCQAAPSCQPTASPFSTFSCTSATWSCSPSPGVLPSLGNGVLFGLVRAVLLSDSLPRRVFTP